MYVWFPANCTLEIGKHMNLLDCQLCIDIKMNKTKMYCMSISCKLKNGVWRYVTAFVTLRNICTFKHQKGVVGKNNFDIFMDPETTNKIGRHVFYRIEKYLFLKKLCQFQIWQHLAILLKKYRQLGSHSKWFNM